MFLIKKIYAHINIACIRNNINHNVKEVMVNKTTKIKYILAKG